MCVLNIEFGVNGLSPLESVSLLCRISCCGRKVRPRLIRICKRKPVFLLDFKRKLFPQFDSVLEPYRQF